MPGVLGVVDHPVDVHADVRRQVGLVDHQQVGTLDAGATLAGHVTTAGHVEDEDLDVVLVESGGDNLTATFSPALVDVQVFVLDVAGGGDAARKGGPGIERADLLVVNKTDLAAYVGVDVEQMVHDAEHARAGRPVLALSRTDPGSVAALAGWVRHRLEHFRAGALVPVDPGPMAAHSHAHAHAHPH